jgi:hypothetical protein
MIAGITIDPNGKEVIDEAGVAHALVVYSGQETRTGHRRRAGCSAH